MSWVPIKDFYTIDLYRFVINAMLPSQKRLLPYEALSACVQPQGKGDCLTDKPGDWFYSYSQFPLVRAKVLGSSTKTRRWVESIASCGFFLNLTAGSVTASNIQALFLVEVKCVCLTDKLVGDFVKVVSNCREGKVPGDIYNKKGDLCQIMDQMQFGHRFSIQPI